MSGRVRDIVVVGGGLAAARAAEAVRNDGFDGRVTLLTDEQERPYERPPLSKGYLLGDQTLDDVYAHPVDFYADADIDVRLGDPATRIDRGAGQVLTGSGRTLRFDRLLLATGAAPRSLPHGDGGLDGILTLRTLHDSQELGARLRAVEHVTVVGAGWIGCEVAAAARSLGVDVAMVDPLDVPLERVLGRQLGQVFAVLHAEHGVDLRMGAGVTAVQGSGSVEQVVLTDGGRIDTQLVVVGIGVTPRVELAEAAGLDVADGVTVDETLRTADPRIFAAGDVASAWHPGLGRHLRVEHWANALNQGRTAGRNLLGAGEPYDRLPYFFSDQYDLGLEYSGHAEGRDEVIVRGSVDAREFLAFWLREGRVVAGMNVNVWDVVEQIEELVRSGQEVDPAQLEDPGVPLADLVGSGSASAPTPSPAPPGRR